MAQFLIRVEKEINRNFKFNEMKKISLIVLAVFAISVLHIQAQDCKVKLEAISGTYEGGCKKKLADGEGEAKGTDTYKGEFKKGLPHGMGIYTWANLNVYEGTFVKGKMEGEGKFTSKSDAEVITGFWKDNEYVGKDKDPFKVLSRGTTTKSVKGRRLSGDKNQVDIVYQNQGKRVSTKRIALRKMDGSFGTILQNGFKKEIQSVVYPFRVMVTGEGSFEFQISQPGHWELTVELMPK